jgi:hypothetical protein
VNGAILVDRPYVPKSRPSQLALHCLSSPVSPIHLVFSALPGFIVLAIQSGIENVSYKEKGFH